MSSKKLFVDDGENVDDDSHQSLGPSGEVMAPAGSGHSTGGIRRGRVGGQEGAGKASEATNDDEVYASLVGNIKKLSGIFDDDNFLNSEVRSFYVIILACYIENFY